jgi:hypothetical protein
MSQMMKLYTAAIGVFLFISAAAPCSAQYFKKGTVLVSAGYGFGNIGAAFFSDLSKLDNYRLRPLGPLLLKGEVAVSDKVSLGINTVYLRSTATFNYLALDSEAMTHTYEARIRTHAYSILGRVNFHFLSAKNIDPYWGFGAGYRGRSTNVTDDQPDGDYGFKINNTITSLAFETTIGMRYYPTPRLGIYGEFGIAKAPVQIGMTYRFGML